ncbi:MAG: hypothetical protein KKF65_05465, partial [Nanoarchaeota archaeon]|nr:hypothetical protein [Nanoarchaeota archaeon]
MNLELIKKNARKIGLRNFYNYTRNFYLQKNDFNTIKISEDKKEYLDKLVSETASLFNVNKERLWETPAFHMAFRITDL